MLLRLYKFISVLTVAVCAVVDRAFIIELAATSALQGRSTGPHAVFHKRAGRSLDYTVRHIFNSSETYVGLSIQVNNEGTNEEIRSQLQAIPGVINVAQVMAVTLPVTSGTSLDPFLSFSDPAPLRPIHPSSASLASPLQMGGVDKLHELGIKGKGIKIGIIDSGVDYRHPALGAGFGPGFKIEGGWAFVADNGTAISSPDPLATCYGGGHGTHVTGLIGMVPVPGQFDITGVAPEATLYAYRVIDCSGHGGTDNIAAAMLKAQQDHVDIVSMSLGNGPQSFQDATDPLADISKKLQDAGIVIVVAAANDAYRGKDRVNLYGTEEPSTIPGNIAIGSTAIKEFPLVYSAVDSQGSTIKYASVFPLKFPHGADVYMLDDACSTTGWYTAMDAIKDINNTIIIFQISGVDCSYNNILGWNGASQQPVILMAYNSNETDPYYQIYNTPSQGYFGTVQFTNVDNIDGAVMAANYEAAGGYLKYKLKFPNKTFQSIPISSGGFMDWYSSHGPTWHEYALKPQFSAPGGHALSLWPLGVLGGYAILSGTSMATPYASASFALLKSQLPKATNDEIKDRLQTTASPLPWIYDTSMVASTAQQGAGAINVYDALFCQTTISPGEFTAIDNSRIGFGNANITITNNSKEPKTYVITHQGAGYTNYRLNWFEIDQIPNYGSANFSQDSITLSPGTSATLQLTITPPTSNVVPSQLPIFSGFVEITSSTERYSIPYIGPAYSIYNTPYILNDANPILPQIRGPGGVVNTGFQEIDPKIDTFSSTIPTLQWTREDQVDLLPANTTITANTYGFDPAATSSFPAYQPSLVTPRSSLFGFESFGNLRTDLGWQWPGNPAVIRSDDLVTGDDGVVYPVGNGDYRWYVSVLRVGGTSGVKEDYDTWLGPIIRIVNS